MRRVGVLQQWTSLAASIRQLMCWLFAITAFTCCNISISLLPGWFRSILHPSYVAGTGWKVMIAAGVLTFPAQAIVFGVAWWTVWRRKPSGRGWAIAASLAYVLAGGITLWSGFFGESPVILLAVGVAGLLVFSPRNLSARLAETAPAEPAPIRGDGSNAVLNKTIGILGLGGFCAAFIWWDHWARNTSLADPVFPFYVEVILAGLATVLVHELGHTVVGKALGMKLRFFNVGPFQWHVREGRWNFQFVPAKIFAVDGATGVVPATLEHFEPAQICMIAAGPFASLVCGLLAFSAALTAPHSPWEPAWRLLALISTLSLLASILNLIPFRAGSAYSDGAQLYQILSGGPWGDYHHVIAIVSSTLVTPLRPRNFDIDAIQRASACITQGPRALHLYLLASHYYLDSDLVLEAIRAIDDAERIYEESASDISAELHTEFIFGIALLKRNAASARQWWHRMEAKKPSRFNADYWLAHSALLWIEDCIDDAEESWEKAFAMVQKLPKYGVYEFDRYRASLLRKALDESKVARQAQGAGESSLI